MWFLGVCLFSRVVQSVWFFSQILGGLFFSPHIAKVYPILHDQKGLSDHSHSILHLVMVSLLLCTELDVAKFLQKEVRKYSIFMKYPRKDG